MMVHLTIDGQPVEVEEGTTILQAAKKACIHIPTLCYHEDLSIKAVCRICVVEVEGQRLLPTACSTPVSEGMVVPDGLPEGTESEKKYSGTDFCETSAGMPRMSEGRKMRSAEGSAGCRNAPRYPL